MSFRFSFAAAALMSARTRLRVALFVRRLVTLVNPWVFALHVVCVELARGELSIPPAILFWVDGVETDVKRGSNWHK